MGNTTWICGQNITVGWKHQNNSFVHVFRELYSITIHLLNFILERKCNMVKVRIILYVTLGLMVVGTCLLMGCETSVDSKYTTRWFYTDPHDPYRSRASGPTSQHGFTSFYKEEEK